MKSKIDSNIVTSFNSGMDALVQKGISVGLLVKNRFQRLIADERGDVPGWVLIVLMTTGLVTAIWAIAKPNLTNILNNSLNSMNGVK